MSRFRTIGTWLLLCLAWAAAGLSPAAEPGPASRIAVRELALEGRSLDGLLAALQEESVHADPAGLGLEIVRRAADVPFPEALPARATPPPRAEDVVLYARHVPVLEVVRRLAATLGLGVRVQDRQVVVGRGQRSVDAPLVSRVFPLPAGFWTTIRDDTSPRQPSAAEFARLLRTCGVSLPAGSALDLDVAGLRLTVTSTASDLELTAVALHAMLDAPDTLEVRAWVLLSDSPDLPAAWTGAVAALAGPVERTSAPPVLTAEAVLAALPATVHARVAAEHRLHVPVRSGLPEGLNDEPVRQVVTEAVVPGGAAARPLRESDLSVLPTVAEDESALDVEIDWRWAQAAAAERAPGPPGPEPLASVTTKVVVLPGRPLVVGGAGVAESATAGGAGESAYLVLVAGVQVAGGRPVRAPETVWPDSPAAAPTDLVATVAAFGPAAAVHLENLGYDKAPLPDVLSDIGARTQAAAPGTGGLPILFIDVRSEKRTATPRERPEVPGVTLAYDEAGRTVTARAPDVVAGSFVAWLAEDLGLRAEPLPDGGVALCHPLVPGNPATWQTGFVVFETDWLGGGTLEAIEPRRFFRNLGVNFPAGASIWVAAGAGRLVVHTDAASVRRLREILHEHNCATNQVGLGARWLSVDPAALARALTARDAAGVAATPLSADDLGALPGSRVVATQYAVSLSGNTAELFLGAAAGRATVLPLRWEPTPTVSADSVTLDLEALLASGAAAARLEGQGWPARPAAGRASAPMRAGLRLTTALLTADRESCTLVLDAGDSAAGRPALVAVLATDVLGFDGAPTRLRSAEPTGRDQVDAPPPAGEATVVRRTLQRLCEWIDGFPFPSVAAGGPVLDAPAAEDGDEGPGQRMAERVAAARTAGLRWLLTEYAGLSAAAVEGVRVHPGYPSGGAILVPGDMPKRVWGVLGDWAGGLAVAEVSGQVRRGGRAVGGFRVAAGPAQAVSWVSVPTPDDGGPPLRLDWIVRPPTAVWQVDLGYAWRDVADGRPLAWGTLTLRDGSETVVRPATAVAAGADGAPTEVAVRLRLTDMDGRWLGPGPGPWYRPLVEEQSRLPAALGGAYLFVTADDLAEELAEFAFDPTGPRHRTRRLRLAAGDDDDDDDNGGDDDDERPRPAGPKRLAAATAGVRQVLAQHGLSVPDTARFVYSERLRALFVRCPPPFLAELDRFLSQPAE